MWSPLTFSSSERHLYEFPVFPSPLLLLSLSSTLSLRSLRRKAPFSSSSPYVVPWRCNRFWGSFCWCQHGKEVMFVLDVHQLPTNIHLHANLTDDHLCWTGSSSGIFSLTEAWHQMFTSFLQCTCTNIHLHANLTDDHLCWTGSSSGIFSLTEAWHQVRSRAVACPWASLVWSTLIHPRLSCFIWQLLHKKTPTQAWAKSIGFNLASQCYLFKADEESDYHLFFSCPFAVEMSTWLLFTYNKPLPESILVGSIWTTIPHGRDEIGRKIAASIFFHLISSIWYSRNQSTFNKFFPPSRLKVFFSKRILEFFSGFQASDLGCSIHPFLPIA